MADPPLPDDRPLPAAAAERLLARAAELDAAGGDGPRLAELRSAAAEAGISVPAFDAALAELRDAERTRAAGGRRPRLWAAAVGLAALVAVGGLTVARERPPGSAAPGTVEEAFLLRCLAPGDAAELLRPLVADPAAGVVISPAHAPRVLTVRATRARLEQVRAALARADGGEGAACARVPSGEAR